MNAQTLSLVLYNLALVPVVIFSIFFLLLSVMNLILDRPEKSKKLKTKPANKYPFVTVQIPSFNDPIAIRCVKKCMKFDYPKSRYEIMIVDDSTDTTTQKMLKKIAKDNRGFVKYIHRKNRQGYKPGALNNAMPYVKGEIMVLFDADFEPHKSFLKRITEPFENPKVAIVQARQGFSNKDVNLISRFAAYLLMIHHVILMPIYNKANCVFFCGTAGAIRKKVIKEVGGWKSNSLAEDTDLSIRILSKGYKNVYLKFETPSEVPVTLEDFLKQQMRWCFGNTRAFIDNAKKIIYQKGLKLRQRYSITFNTLGNVIAPVIIIMTIAGLSGWFLGEPELFNFSDFLELLIKLSFTAGFLVLGATMFYRHKSMGEFPKLLLAAFSVSIVLAFANSIAIFKAIFFKDKPLFGTKTAWICTPKQGNTGFYKR